MKRYCISPVVGSGAQSDPYRAAVDDVSGVSSNSIIPTDSNDGSPLFNFAFSIVAASGMAGVQAVTNSFVFPDYPLDAQMGSMDSGTRTAMNQSVHAFDFGGSVGHIDMTQYGDTDSYRAVIEYVAQKLEPVFDSQEFDSPDLA